MRPVSRLALADIAGAAAWETFDRWRFERTLNRQLKNRQARIALMQAKAGTRSSWNDKYGERF